MWMPGDEVSKLILSVVLKCFDNDRFKSELAKSVQTQINMQNNNYSGHGVSYDSLTSGTVNMQAKMAAAGNPGYGRVYFKGQHNSSNKNIYNKMKNKIHYNTPSKQKNKGSYEFI